ncbi:shikimate dehydrogenase [Clostridium bovifaecis]|uniref:Shikimate dehydrogenase (NADP(+)) n=1 Tax=Clostridium bovifaecis TaxID=2184719 RepID=A0A6I6ESQ0_9CLOT|nr:shikimate dehydrogenase [Clostridium bovifaecis]
MKGLYGLLGEKLGHSFSPGIHSLIFKELGLEGYYHLFEVDKAQLEYAVLGFNALKIKGVNVTIPYKVDAMKYLDRISQEGKNIGAINTICFEEGETIGYNTDYYGFGMMLNKFNINLKWEKAVILGTGGVSRAVLQYLLDNDVRDITFVSRNIEEVKTRFKEFNIIEYEKIKELRDKDIVINCTPLGMYPKVEVSPLTKEQVSQFKIVIDLIYNPQETLLLRYANENGIQGINGLYMLVGQAVKAQELWNSVKIDEEIVDKVYKQLSDLL